MGKCSPVTFASQTKENKTVQYFQIPQATPHQVTEGSANRIVHAHGMTAAFWNMAKGAPLTVHAHEHEQLLYVVSGALEITASGKTVLVRAGEMLVFASNEAHGGVAVEDSLVMDVFTPVREDFQAKFPFVQESAL